MTVVGAAEWTARIVRRMERRYLRGDTLLVFTPDEKQRIENALKLNPDRIAGTDAVEAILRPMQLRRVPRESRE